MKRLTIVAVTLSLWLPAAWAQLAAAQTQPDPTQRRPRAEAVPEGLSAPDWSSIRQQYEYHRHAAFPVPGGHQARNPGQQWQTRFDGGGFLTTPDAADWQ